MLLRNFTKPFYHIAKVSNEAIYIFLSEPIYSGSIKGVLLPYYLHVEVPYGATYLRTYGLILKLKKYEHADNGRS